MIWSWESIKLEQKKSIEKEISKEPKFISESMILLTKSPSNHDLTLKLMEPCFCGKLSVCRHWIKCFCGSNEGTKSHKHDLVLRKHQFGAKKSVQRELSKELNFITESMILPTKCPWNHDFDTKNCHCRDYMSKFPQFEFSKLMEVFSIAKRRVLIQEVCLKWFHDHFFKNSSSGGAFSE